MTPKNIAVEPDVLEALKRRAAADGLTLDQAANHVIQVGLREASWEAFLAKGRAYGQASGYGPDDVERIRDDWRAEHGA